MIRLFATLFALLCSAAAAEAQGPKFLLEPTPRSFSDGWGGFEISLTADPPINYRIEFSWPVFAGQLEGSSPANLGRLSVRVPQGAVWKGSGALQHQRAALAGQHQAWRGVWLILVIETGDQIHIELRLLRAATDQLRSLGAESILLAVWAVNPGEGATSGIEINLPLASIPAPAERVPTSEILKP